MEKEYLLRERPGRALFLFALPMIVGNLFQQFYTMADSMVVGRYVSEHALAAVGASYSLTNVFICVAIGGGVGASVVTSHYFGSRDYASMKRSVSTALLTFLGLSILLALLGFFLGSRFMSLLRTPEELLPMATEYLRIYFLGLPFLFLYNVLSAMFNALGRSRIPLYLLIFSSVLNIALDVYMVRSLGLGIAGVAWATLLAQGLAALLSFLLFLRELGTYPLQNGVPLVSPHASPLWEQAPSAAKPTRRGFALSALYSLPELKSMSRVALPSIFQQSTVSIGMMLVQSVVNSFGPQILAGFSAGMRVESICIVPMAALGNAMSSYTAQNLGSGQQARVTQGYHAALRLTALFALLLCLVLELFHRPIIASFLGSDGTALALKTGSDYLRFIGFFFALIGLKMTTDGLLRGAAHMKMFTIANLANLSLRVILAVLLAPRFGIAMVWYAVPLGWLVNFLISFREYRTGRWKPQE